MPMKSQAQRAWMWMHHPEMAARWEKHTLKGKRLPKHVSAEGWQMDQYAPGAYQDMEWQRKWDPDEEPLPPLGEMFGLSMDDDEMRDDDVRQEEAPEDVPDILSPRLYYGWPTNRRAT